MGNLTILVTSCYNGLDIQFLPFTNPKYSRDDYDEFIKNFPNNEHFNWEKYSDYLSYVKSQNNFITEAFNHTIIEQNRERYQKHPIFARAIIDNFFSFHETGGFYSVTLHHHPTPGAVYTDPYDTKSKETVIDINQIIKNEILMASIFGSYKAFRKAGEQPVHNYDNDNWAENYTTFHNALTMHDVKTSKGVSDLFRRFKDRYSYSNFRDKKSCQEVEFEAFSLAVNDARFRHDASTVHKWLNNPHVFERGMFKGGDSIFIGNDGINYTISPLNASPGISTNRQKWFERLIAACKRERSKPLIKYMAVNPNMHPKQLDISCDNIESPTDNRTSTLYGRTLDLISKSESSDDLDHQTPLKSSLVKSKSFADNNRVQPPMTLGLGALRGNNRISPFTTRVYTDSRQQTPNTNYRLNTARVEQYMPEVSSLTDRKQQTSNTYHHLKHLSAKKLNSTFMKSSIQNMLRKASSHEESKSSGSNKPKPTKPGWKY